MPLVHSFVDLGPVLDPDMGSYYTNLTGFWHGEIDVHNLTSLSTNDSISEWSSAATDFVSHTNMTELPELLGTWKWGATEKLSLSVGDKIVVNQTLPQNVSGDISIIHVRIFDRAPFACQ